MIAIYPGSFDPVTYGHIDIIKRASIFTEKLFVGVLNNSSKTHLFSAEERVEMLIELTKDMDNVEIVSFDGLTVNFAREHNAKVVIRGLRAVTDFEYEFQMALTNRILAEEVETLFISTCAKYIYLSSSVVKEIAKYGGNIENMVDEKIRIRLLEKYSNRDGS